MRDGRFTVLHFRCGDTAATALDLGRLRSLRSDAKLVPTRSAAELVDAAAGQGSGRMFLLAAGLGLHARAIEKLLHLIYGAGAGE